MKIKLILTIITLVATWGAVCAAATWHVAPDGDDTNTGADWSHALLTISNATDKASDGDVILLANGVYLANGEGTNGNQYRGKAAGISMVTLAKGVTVRGASGNPADVILDGGYSNGAAGAFTNRLVFLYNPEARLEAVTVTNGYIPGDGNEAGNGGGIYLHQGVVSNCVIVNNFSGSGGGLYIEYSASATATHCRIEGNITTNSTAAYYRGGAVGINGGVLSNCEVLNNTNLGVGTGGIVYNHIRGSQALIADCVVSNNGQSRADIGGINMRNINAPVNIVRCTVVDNSAAGIYCNFSQTQPLVISHCFVARNRDIGIQLTCQNAIVTDCNVVSNYAIGIALDNGRSNTVQRCDILHNTSSTAGGGIRLDGPQHVVSNCNIIGNFATGGGGITASYNNAVSNLITGCSIISNTATTSDGAGISLGGQYPDHIIQNCRIMHNKITATGKSGGGVYAARGGLLQNCLIVSNSATHRGGGVFGVTNLTNLACTIAFNSAGNNGGGLWLHNASGGFGNNSVINTIIYSNTGGSKPEAGWQQSADTNAFWYCCTPEALNSAGHNITDAPQWVSPYAGDFRLADVSPCINAGTNQPWMENAVDLDGRPRLDRFTRQADIGCYEYLRRGLFFLFR